jgi:alkaline phosphatase D
MMMAGLALVTTAEIGLIMESEADEIQGPYNAMGERVGEVTATSAILHVRLTEKPERNSEPPLIGEVPGSPGMVRVHYGTDSGLSSARITDWVSLGPETDFSTKVHLQALTPRMDYYYKVEIASPDGISMRFGKTGQFRTAPRGDDPVPVLFTVVTGQATKDADCPEGFKTFKSMAELGPDFLISTGDNVYYDADPPAAHDVTMARFHWHRMYSQPSMVDFFRGYPGYWQVDDHDYRFNNSSPTITAPGGILFELQARLTGTKWLTADEGKMVFLEQVPIQEPTFRTFRWGSGVQVWITDSRLFRSKNRKPNGPGKTIWGQEQKQWLKASLLESDAAFRIISNSTPMVGPDTIFTRDNHAAAFGFRHEAREFFDWAEENGINNLYLVVGDRHWQTHQVHPTGVHQFACGAVSDIHAINTRIESAPAPKSVQPFLRKLGGFLSVKVEPRTTTWKIIFRFHNVDGKIVYEYNEERPG